MDARVVLLSTESEETKQLQQMIQSIGIIFIFIFIFYLFIFYIYCYIQKGLLAKLSVPLKMLLYPPITCYL